MFHHKYMICAIAMNHLDTGAMIIRDISRMQ